MLEGACLLMVAVVMVPDKLGCLVGVGRGLGRRSNQHGAENAGTPPRPPFGHLVDGLARIAFQIGERIDLRDGKVRFQAGWLALRIGKIRHRQFDRLAELVGEQLCLFVNF